MTEIITIPESWKMQNILENSTLKARIGWQGLTTTEYKKTGKVYLVTGTDFKDGKIDWENCVYVDEKRYSQDKNIQIKIDDVLVTKDGTIGKIAYVDKLPLPTTLNSGIFVIRPIKNDYLHLFLFYILSSNYFIKFLNKLKAGSTIIHLYQKDFASFNFVVPPISEQQQIIQILSNTDKLIEKLEKIIEKKKNIKQGAMQELLTGKRRLSGFSGKWKIKKLGDVLKVKHGKSQKEISDEHGQYPILATSGKIGMTREFLYDKPSVLIGRKGTIDKPQYMDTPFWTIDTLFYTEIFSGTDPKFILYKFKSINWYSYNEASGVPSLNASTIENIEQPFPPTKEEQSAIAQILSDMDSEIKELETKRNKYVMIKNGMMQKLLTGEIRVK